jgi:hypothetical protein
MRHLVCAASLLLMACNGDFSNVLSQEQESASNSEIDELLKQGSAKACVDSFVKNSVLALITPKPESIDPSYGLIDTKGDLEPYQQQVAAQFTPDLTNVSLANAIEKTSEVWCDAKVTVGDRSYSLQYRIRPAIEEANQPLLAGNFEEIRGAIRTNEIAVVSHLILSQPDRASARDSTTEITPGSDIEAPTEDANASTPIENAPDG